MNLNVLLGTLGSVWLTVIGPQLIMNVFYKNTLGASSVQLGLLVAATQVAAVFNLLAILIYARLPRVKPFWLATSLVHRLYGFVPAAVCLSVLRGGSTAEGARVMLIAISVSWSLANVSASGWFKWVMDIVPEDSRSSFFGRRSAIINVGTAVFFLLATTSLDLFKGSNVFLVYFFVFIVAAAAGVADIAFHAFIPEPRAGAPRREDARGAPAAAAGALFAWRDFAEPVRNRNFIGFSLCIGLWLLSVNVLNPFVAPYITSAEGIGAPNTWLGIITVITQLAYVTTSMSWGMLMDRLGRKPVVLLGSLYPLCWIGYFFLTRSNYTILLPLTALAQGLLSPAILDGAGQLMLTLTPQRNRTAYVAWYSAIAGLIPAGGALLGGVLSDLLGGLHLSLGGAIAIGGFQAVTLLSFVLCIPSFLILSRIREGKEKPVGFLVQRIMSPSVFRTFLTINVLGRGEEPGKVARALRAVESASGALAVSDIIKRLDDPDAEVREEAARALGRTGSADAVEPLLRHLGDPYSTIRSHAARALGLIGDPRAVDSLIEGLDARSEELQEACCHALARLGATKAMAWLLRLFGEDQSDRVIGAAGEAMSHLGAMEAAIDILPRMHETDNRVLRRQFAIALGNLLGTPGEFYRYVTGGRAGRSAGMERLAADAQRNVQELLSEACAGELADQTMQDAQGALAAALLLMRQSVEAQDNAGVIETLWQILLRLCRLLYGRDIAEEEAIGFALMHRPRLGLGLWFTSEVRSRLRSLADTELLDMYAAIGVYFLGSYRGELQGT